VQSDWEAADEGSEEANFLFFGGIVIMVAAWISARP
jgi:hypothetical protein